MSGHKPYRADCVYVGWLRERIEEAIAHMGVDDVAAEIQQQVSYYVDGVKPGSVSLMPDDSDPERRLVYFVTEYEGRRYVYGFSVSVRQ